MAEDTQKKALDEFEAIRKVLRVPFPEDMRDLFTSKIPKPEFPSDRQWKGLCLGFQSNTTGLPPTGTV